MIQLASEFGKLQTVLVHRPGREIERLRPNNLSDLLFNDLPFLEKMQNEHDVFARMIWEASGAKVLRVEDLLKDVLRDEKLRLEAFRFALWLHNPTELAEDILERLSTAQAASALISGVRWREAGHINVPSSVANVGKEDFIFPPCPNMYFTRDSATFTPAGTFYTKMKYLVRRRESYIVKLIFDHHPEFAGKVKYVGTPSPVDKEDGFFEGGDILILSPKAVVIGNSERTDADAIDQFARDLIANSDVERVYEVLLPHTRNYMHLDTVFTIIDENLVITFPDAIQDKLKTHIYHKDGYGEANEPKLRVESVQSSIFDVLKRERPHMEIIEVAGGHPEYAPREQWFDAANVFAVGPRKVIAYDRNVITNRALRQAGVQVLEIPASELSRGLGGPRCMTLSIEREPV